MGLGAQLDEFLAHRVDDLNVEFFCSCRSRFRSYQTVTDQQSANRAVNVFTIQPITRTNAIVIYRQSLGHDSIDDQQLSHLLWKVIRSIVVAAIGHQRRQNMNVMQVTHLMITGQLASSVKHVAVRHGNSLIIFDRPAKHLVSRNVKKAQARLCNRLFTCL